ncbi:DUF4384 domain-containing protein [bacterium]|nr:DUF4384 domain-containing protein [bacterium]
MKKNLCFALLILLFSRAAEADFVAEVGYVTGRGRVFLSSSPGERLTIGQKLERSDIVELMDGAQIRLFFRDLNRSKKYRAPAIIRLSEEYKTILRNPAMPDPEDRILSEISRVKNQYLKPIYTRYAGSRSLQIMPDSKVHDCVPGFSLSPHLVVRAQPHIQYVEVYDGDGGEKLAGIPVPEGSGPVAVRIRNARLEYGRTYAWKLAGDETFGELKIIGEEDAREVQETLQKLARNAIDSTEAAVHAAVLLLDEGFWAEAFVQAQEAMTGMPDRSMLQNLIQAILNQRPDDFHYSETLKNAEKVRLQFSFHIRKGERLVEIADGDTVRSGDRMQIRLQPPSDTYLFVLNLDAGRRLFVLFPRQDEDHFIPGGREIVIPAGNRYFLADTQTGEEKIFLVASALPLDFLAAELDRYFAAGPEAGNNRAVSTLDGLMARGFSAITEDPGVKVQELHIGPEPVELTRFLLGKGLLVEEIRFTHLQ